MKKRVMCFLSAAVLFLLLFPGVSPADGCDHAVRPSEWVLKGYIDPQHGVPGYSGDFCCPICGAVMKKGEPIEPLPEEDDPEQKRSDPEDPDHYGEIAPAAAGMDEAVPQVAAPPAVFSGQCGEPEPAAAAPAQAPSAPKPAGTASAEEKNTTVLGKPFPDFTATDTEGNLFTLSEALKDHEAVLINFWATWCGPCRNEFPFLNEAYEKYRGRVAFIALSTEKKDTMEKIEAYRKENGISFPMGRYADEKMYEYIDTSGIPDTVIVDRFGNAAFFHGGAFPNARALELVLDTFLGDSYTETAVLNEIPKDTFTHAYPVFSSKAIYPENGNYRKVLIRSDRNPEPVPGYIVPEESVRLRIEIAPDDDAANMVYADMFHGVTVPVTSLLDPDRGVYVYDQELPGPTDELHYMAVALFDAVSGDDAGRPEIRIYLFISEESVSETVEEANASGEGKYSWEYADADERAESTQQAYLLHVVDQDNSPVGEVTVNFCTDTACVPRESGDDGLIIFTGAPDVYHVTVVDVPDGYSWDEEYEMYTPREYGEWVLRIRKD